MSKHPEDQPNYNISIPPGALTALINSSEEDLNLRGVLEKIARTAFQHQQDHQAKSHDSKATGKEVLVLMQKS